MPTDGRRQGASSGVAILVDTRTAEVERVSSEQREKNEEMTADILTKYCEWPRTEQHCATLNLCFSGEGIEFIDGCGDSSCTVPMRTLKWCQLSQV